MRIKANNSDIKVTNNSSPEVVDWNEDGLLDLLVGSDASADGVQLFLNSGTTTDYTFTTSSKLKAGNTTIGYSREQIQVVDLNYDGKKDFLIGNGLSTPETRIYFYENIGTNADPELKAAVPLMTKTNNPVYPDGGYDIFFDVADWNDDGGWDILMGDYNGTKIKLYLGDPHTAISTNGPIKNTNSIMRVYTNSNTFVTKISLDQASRVRLSVVGINGRIIKSADYGMVPAGKHRFDIGNNKLTSGVYYINCILDRGRLERERVIVAR